MTMHVNRRLEALTHRAGLSAGGGLRRSSLLLVGSFAHRVRRVRRVVLVTGMPNGRDASGLTLLVKRTVFINRADRTCLEPLPLRDHTNREDDDDTGNRG